MDGAPLVIPAMEGVAQDLVVMEAHLEDLEVSSTLENGLRFAVWLQTWVGLATISKKVQCFELLLLQGPHGSLKSLKVFKNMKSMKSL